MKIQDLTRDERIALAEAVDTSEQYLYQCATGRRQPGIKMCQRLVAADPRLTLQELRPDIWSSSKGMAA